MKTFRQLSEEIELHESLKALRKKAAETGFSYAILRKVS